MSNRRFTQFFLTPHAKPVLLNVDIPIGATGAVGTLANNTGISAVTRITTGTYKIAFADNYNKCLGMDWDCWSPNSGSSILVASAGTVSGTVYVITIVGTTTTAGWQTLGLAAGVTPAVGVAFKATATTTATGTGAVQVQAAAGSTIIEVEVIGNPNTTINPTGVPAGAGYIIIQTLAATNSSTTTLVATDPVSGTQLQLGFYFNDSSLVAGY